MAYTIHDAAADGDLPGVKDQLLHDKSQVNKTDASGWTSLHYAAAGNHTHIASHLIENGADINAKTVTDGKTPLHWAAFYGHFPIVELLVTTGAKINEKDDDGFTALGIAERTELRNVMHLLEEHGGI